MELGEVLGLYIKGITSLGDHLEIGEKCVPVPHRLSHALKRTTCTHGEKRVVRINYLREEKSSRRFPVGWRQAVDLITYPAHDHLEVEH